MISEQIAHLNAGNRKYYDCLLRELHATAAILTAALNVLDRPDLQNALVREIQKAQTIRPSRTPLASVLDRHRTACSPELREAIEPAIRRYRRQAGPGSPKAPARVGGYRPEHIPAFLEDAWFERHLAPLDCRSRLSKVLRRAAAATLVQWSAGGSVGDAADYLGINPNGGQYAFTKDLYQWLASDPDRIRFTTALENLAAELDTTAVLSTTAGAATPCTPGASTNTPGPRSSTCCRPSPGPFNPPSTSANAKKSPRSSGHTSPKANPAPRPAPSKPQPPHTQREWLQRRANTWHHLNRETPLAHYAALKNILARHAGFLAEKIDAGGLRTRR